MIAFFFCSSANWTAGRRYASDLPTPVPASTTRCRSSSSARATATAISCCCGRNSKFFAFESRPFSEKIVRTRSTNSVPRESLSAIIEIWFNLLRETARPLRDSQFFTGLFLLHRRLSLHLADFRRQRQHFDIHRRTF